MRVPAFMATAPPRVPGMPAANSQPVRPAASGALHEPGHRRASGEHEPLPVARLLAEVDGEPDHHPADAGVGDEQVGAAAQHQHGHAARRAVPEERRQVGRVGRAHQEVGRARPRGWRCGGPCGASGVHSPRTAAATSRTQSGEGPGARRHGLPSSSSSSGPTAVTSPAPSVITTSPGAHPGPRRGGQARRGARGPRPCGRRRGSPRPAPRRRRRGWAPRRRRRRR